ncbi:MAG: hypothetical protein NTY53_01915 [Kiritimatiellaeota bacterium]|nr:hypothetical protein [Kiritimatiellota bacterium]
MKFYSIEPEVAGGWGKNTVFTRSPGGSSVVHRLHYEFDGWLGDELLESTPCFIVSESMAREITQAHFTGAHFDEVEITTSQEFQELCPNRQLPKFVWLKVDGQAGRDDFGIGSDGRLVVSGRVLAALRSIKISHALITEVPL